MKEILTRIRRSERTTLRLNRIKKNKAEITIKVHMRDHISCDRRRKFTK